MIRGPANGGDQSPQAPDGSGASAAALAALGTQQIAASGIAKPAEPRTGFAIAISGAASGTPVGTSSPLELGGASPIEGGAAQALGASDARSAILPADTADGKIASAVPDAAAHAPPAANDPSASTRAGAHATPLTAAAGGPPSNASADVPTPATAGSLPTPLPAEIAAAHPIDVATIGIGSGTAISVGSSSAQAGAAASTGAAADPAETSSLPAFPPATSITDDAGTSIRVTSGELGTVEVRLGTTDDGTASVTVAADRAETLNVLAADRDQMQAVLAQAGVEPAGRRIEYTLLTADAAPAGAGQSGGGSSGGGDQGGSQRDGGTRDAHADRSFSSGGRNLSQDATQLRSASKTHYIRRATVDITA